MHGTRDIELARDKSDLENAEIVLSLYALLNAFKV